MGRMALRAEQTRRVSIWASQTTRIRLETTVTDQYMLKESKATKRACERCRRVEHPSDLDGGTGIF